MLQIFNKYDPNANPPSTDYPNGSGKDESVSGANDGTPLEMDWYNDMLGFSEALLAQGRLTPSGNADTALVSDRLDGFRLAALRVQTACDFTNGELTLVDVIHVGLDITTVEYVIDRNSLTRWSTSGTTGTVTADDLDTTTGALSGVSGMLTQVNPLNSNNNLSDVADESTAFDNIKQLATESETGVAREATQAEVDARSGDGFVTASKLEAVLGVNQTWQNVTSMRPGNSDFTSPDRAIEIFLTLSSPNTLAGFYVVVGGVDLCPLTQQSSGTLLTVSLTVPANTVYRVNITGSMIIEGWSELR